MTQQWLQRWQDGNIGWHEAEGNSSLKKYWNASGRRVLVPLCGKSHDLILLESLGNDVVGVELSEIAVNEFFRENEISYTVVDGRLTEYIAQDRSITIFCGDYFNFSSGPFDAYYDRGALVALPETLRREFAEHSRSLLTKDAVQMIIAVEYDESVVTGPPFSVPASEILSHWPELRRVDAYDDIENGPPKFREAGLDKMLEVVWHFP